MAVEERATAGRTAGVEPGFEWPAIEPVFNVVQRETKQISKQQA